MKYKWLWPTARLKNCFLLFTKADHHTLWPVNSYHRFLSKRNAYIHLSKDVYKPSISPRTSLLSCQGEKLPWLPVLWQNLRCVAFWPSVCDFILLEHSLSPWELQLSISLLWLNQERRHMQISTEIMIP